MSTQNDIIVLLVVAVILGSVFVLSYFMGRKDKKELDADLETFLREEEQKNLTDNWKVTSDIRDKASVSDAPPMTKTWTAGGPGEVINVSLQLPKAGVPNKNGMAFTQEAIDSMKKTITAPEFKNFSISSSVIDGMTAKVVKLKKGSWGCSLCPDKVYQHKSSAHKHIAKKHK
jgi:hypothetical protein